MLAVPAALVAAARSEEYALTTRGLAAAAGIRGEPDPLLEQLAAEAKRHEAKAYAAHLILPLMMLGAGAVFYWLVLSGNL